MILYCPLVLLLCLHILSVNLCNLTNTDLNLHSWKASGSLTCVTAADLQASISTRYPEMSLKIFSFEQPRQHGYKSYALKNTPSAWPMPLAWFVSVLSQVKSNQSFHFPLHSCYWESKFVYLALINFYRDHEIRNLCHFCAPSAPSFSGSQRVPWLS